MLSELFAFRHVLHSICIARLTVFKIEIACKKQSVCCEQRRETIKNYAVIYIPVLCMHVDMRHSVLTWRRLVSSLLGRAPCRPSTWHWAE